MYIVVVRLGLLQTLKCLSKRLCISIENPNAKRKWKSSIVVAKEVRIDMRAYLRSNIVK